MQRASGIDAFAGGFYNDGGPGGGGASTVPKAGDLNAMQEEIARFIESQGITLSPGPDEPGDIAPGDYQQLGIAINRAANGSENLILNPQFRIAQTGPGPWNISDTPEHICDMWMGYADGPGGVGNGSVLRNALPPGSGSPWELEVRTVNPSSVSGAGLLQKIEGVGTLSGGYLSVSLTGRFLTSSANLRMRVTQVFGTGGSPSAAVVSGVVDVALANSDTEVSGTFQLVSITGKTLGSNGDDHLLVELEMPTGSNDRMYLRDVHCVAGAVPKPFRARMISDELSRCRRYYETSITNGVTPGDWVAANGASGMHRMYRPIGSNMAALSTRFHTEKRSTPAMYWYEGWGPTGLSVSNGVNGKVILLPDGGSLESRSVLAVSGVTRSSTGFPSSISGIVTSSASLAGHWTADARL